VPRSRTGNFRPASLPPPYERGYSDEMHAYSADCDRWFRERDQRFR
jgi:hypothetical protein